MIVLGELTKGVDQTKAIEEDEEGSSTLHPRSETTVWYIRHGIDWLLFWL